jgi:hypothetical protein
MGAATILFFVSDLTVQASKLHRRNPSRSERCGFAAMAENETHMGMKKNRPYGYTASLRLMYVIFTSVRRRQITFT